MNETGLSEQVLNLIRSVLVRHQQITGALVFGSRAKGTYKPNSDIDLALEGVDDFMQTARIAGELDDLPLPYTFDVQAVASIKHPGLREHIARVGVRIYG